MNKKISFLLAISILIGGFIVLKPFDTSQETTSEITESTSSFLSNEITNTILTIGESEAPVTIVEYFDYKCPACNGFHQTVHKDIDDTYIKPGLVKYEIRITPIIGPDSATAARGAYCANEQGVFADYHEAVLKHMYDNYYANRNYSAEYESILTSHRLAEIGASFIPDRDNFVECTDSEKYNIALDANLEAAADDSIRGTPGFKVGRQSFVGGQPFNVFRTLIEIELGR